MAEFWNRPFRGRVARGAVLAEESEVMVFGLMTRRAIQQPFFRPQVRGGRLWRIAGFFEPAFNLRRVHARLLRLAFEFLETDTREGDVIHLRRARHPALVFEMTGGTRADLRMKGGRLTLEERFVVGMADDAVFCLNSFDRRVAGGAIILQRRVGLRQFTGTYHVLPKGQRENFTRWLFPVMSVVRGKRKERDDGQGQSDGRKQECVSQFHIDHLSPK